MLDYTEWELFSHFAYFLYYLSHWIHIDYIEFRQLNPRNSQRKLITHPGSRKGSRYQKRNKRHESLKANSDWIQKCMIWMIPWWIYLPRIYIRGDYLYWNEDKLWIDSETESGLLIVAHTICMFKLPIERNFWNRICYPHFIDYWRFAVRLHKKRVNQDTFELTGR